MHEAEINLRGCVERITTSVGVDASDVAPGSGQDGQGSELKRTGVRPVKREDSPSQRNNYDDEDNDEEALWQEAEAVAAADVRCHAARRANEAKRDSGQAL